MKKLTFSIFALLVMFAVVGISCKSTPAADLEAKTKAEEARQRAIDFESPAYFPSEWEELEAQFAAAGEMPTSKKKDAQLAAERYAEIAEAYDELFSKTIPLYAQAREDEIISVREELVQSGLPDVFPEYLRKADDLALAAKDQYEAKDYYKAKDTAAQALIEYETLLAGAKTFTARQEIVDRGFAWYDSDNFDKADEVSQKAMEEYNAGNYEASVNSAEEAILRYNIVLANGWTIYAAERHTSANEERQLALNERVNIASREFFREADALFTQAEQSLASEDYQNAALHFIDAEAFFTLARMDTDEKRQKAEETIRLAEEKVEVSNETALEAERIIEGGSR